MIFIVIYDHNYSQERTLWIPPIPRRSHPAQHGEGFDAPPTLERSGSERRGGAVTSLALLERARAWEWVKDPPSREGQEGLYTIHLLIILLILPRSNMIHPFLVLEIPFYGFLDTLLKLERWLLTQFLLQLSRVDGITHIVTLSVCYISNEVRILAFPSAEQKEQVRYGFQYPYFKPCLSLSSNQSARASSKLHLN